MAEASGIAETRSLIRNLSDLVALMNLGLSKNIDELAVQLKVVHAALDQSGQARHREIFGLVEHLRSEVAVLKSEVAVLKSDTNDIRALSAGAVDYIAGSIAQNFYGQIERLHSEIAEIRNVLARLDSELKLQSLGYRETT